MTGPPKPTGDLRERLQRSLGDAIALERELGGGGMARVFLGTERALDRQIVVKTLDLEVAIASGAERFRREIKVVAQLQHPHIVPVFTAGGDDTLLWYTMPYVSGESLRARLSREGALPVSDAVRITREVLDALGAAHARGVVHRDVKPDNILLEGAHAQVADFGVAKALADAGVSTSLTGLGLALGTPAYMAPEQAMADPTTNHRADLYAVGAVLFEMLVGAPPFGGNAQAVVAAHLTAPVPQVSDRRRDVPPTVEDLVRRLLAKNPAERPQSATEAIAALESLTTPVAAAAPTVRRRAPLIGTAIAATIAIVAIGAWAMTRPSAPDFAEGTEVIAVMPFGSTGDTALTRLGRDLVVTMSANIDGVGSVRTVDAMSVLQRASDLPQPVSLEAARALAASLGATYILHGALVPDDNGVRADAAFYDVAASTPIARIGSHAQVAGLRELTDSLSSQLLRQIWRRGTPPSPMLADAATPSGEALRAFLEGEEAFDRLDVPAALEAYGKATTLDSNFVQAWLRISHVRSASLLPADTNATRRLEALVDRMPERDRAGRFRFSPGTSFADRLAAYQSYAARFPEYHMAQYRAGDQFIHNGPLLGVPMTDAIPYLNRLDSLAPRHADNAQHRLMVAMARGDTAEIRSSANRMVQLGGNSVPPWGKAAVITSEAYARTGMLADAATMTTAVRQLISGLRTLPVVAEAGLFVTPPLSGPAQLDSAFAAVASDPEVRAFERQYLLAVATHHFSRGDVASALKVFARLEASSMPNDVRTAGIRSAASAAWLGLITQGEADASAAESRRSLANGPQAVMTDVHWSDAVLAISAQDSMRFATALRALADTSVLHQRISRGLRALWRERQTGQVDSLIASEDDEMRTLGTFLPMVPLTRLAIGRALTLANDPRRAEYYLQWTDGIQPPRRAVQIVRAMTAYTAYQRGIAAEAAGDRRAAILYLRRFVEFVDRPPPAIADQVKDAKSRLEKLVSRAG